MIDIDPSEYHELLKHPDDRPKGEGQTEEAMEELKREMAKLLNKPLKLNNEPREHLLYDETGKQDLLPKGRVALLVSSGASGKTTLLMQLAVSIATGERWLGRFRVNMVEGQEQRAGKVLYIMGEEDSKEAGFKAHYSFEYLREKGDPDMKLLDQNLRVFPGHGENWELITPDGDTSSTTPKFKALISALRDMSPWRAIILDPAAQFAAGDENDNRAATRFVKVIERLASPELGNPTVIMAHHSRKGGGVSQDSARGASALVSNTRQCINLLKEDGVVYLSISKANYSPEDLRIALKWDAHTFRPILPEEQEGMEFKAMVERAIVKKEQVRLDKVVEKEATRQMKGEDSQEQAGNTEGAKGTQPELQDLWAEDPPC